MAHDASHTTPATSGGASGESADTDPDALGALVATLPSLVALIDADGTLRAWSERWSYVFAPDLASPDSEEGPPRFEDLFRDPDGAWADTFATCRADGTSARGYTRPLSLIEGTTYWVDWEVQPRPETDDGAVLLHLTDRTGEHQAELLRRQVERRFDALVDTISEGVLLMDDQGVFRDCNDAAQYILGRSASDIVGTKFNDDRWNGLREDGTPLPNAEFPFWRAYFERETVRNEVMGIYPPGEPPRWIRVNAQPLFRNGSDDPYGVLICFDDITDEQLKDEALQTSRDLLSSVLTSSLDAILVFSASRDEAGAVQDFECLLANPQAEKMAEQGSDDLVGTSMRYVMPDAESNELFDACVEVADTGEPFEAEMRYDTADGLRWLHVVVVKIDDGVALTLRDVSERREAAQAMAAANAKLEQRNRALRDFAYIASHDLQEPLRKISAFSNLVLEDYGDQVDDTGHHYLERMQDAAQRMSQLISDLLVYSRVTTRARPFEPVDLGSIVQNVRNDLDMQIQDVDGTVQVSDLPTIEADPTQMRQLLQNLIGNGLKFHRDDEPPVVTVRADIVEPSEETTQLVDASCAQVCRLTVEDNGIGFEQKYADRIFTPFKRLHGRSAYAGTGMGLAICRRIVERHGGDISVQSTPGEGTLFTVTLPVDRADDGPYPSGDSVTDHAPTE